MQDWSPGAEPRSRRRERRAPGQAPDESDLERLRTQLQECAGGRGGEVSTRQRAARPARPICAWTTSAATPSQPDRPRVRPRSGAGGAERARLPGRGSARRGNGTWKPSCAPRCARRRLRILTQFNAIPRGQVPRRPACRPAALHRRRSAAQPLDRELETRLSAWFDVGFLELQRIRLGSPAALLPRSSSSTRAVYEIRSWKDLKNRLDSDRRCYAFFHRACHARAADLRSRSHCSRRSPTTCSACSTSRRRSPMRGGRRPRSSIRSAPRKGACAG